MDLSLSSIFLCHSCKSADSETQILNLQKRRLLVSTGKTGLEGAADAGSGFEGADSVGDGKSGFISSVSSSSDQAFSDSLNGSNPSEM